MKKKKTKKSFAFSLLPKSSLASLPVFRSILVWRNHQQLSFTLSPPAKFSLILSYLHFRSPNGSVSTANGLLQCLERDCSSAGLGKKEDEIIATKVFKGNLIKVYLFYLNKIGLLITCFRDSF